MAILAVQAIRKMRGNAQSQLMLAADGNFWIVKFQNNPQHVRVLANEMIATRLAVAAGLTVPACDIVEVKPWLVENARDLRYELGEGQSARYTAGLQFGSKMVGSPKPGPIFDYLPDEQLGVVLNLAEFAGILAMDKWTANCDSRQAVFARSQQERKYTASFIDHGSCFNAGDWNFPDAPLQGIYLRRRVYGTVTGWDCFEPWLHRIEEMEASIVWGIAEAVPPEWYGGDLGHLESLMERLMSRRRRVRELILSFRDSDWAPFPLWAKSSRVSVL